MKKIKFNFWLLPLGIILGAACATFLIGRTTAQQAQTASATDNEYQTGAVLWFQTAAENRALAYQAFALARSRVYENRKKCRQKKSPCAVVVDIDETVLDNSPNQAWQIKYRRSFNQADWLDWVRREEAKPISGAREFLQYAAENRIKVFYVSNRREEERTATANNLKKVGFPDVSDETLILRRETSSKEERRQAIAQKYRIVLLVGDNLNDFAQVFERKSITDRFAAVEQLKNEFGNRFIVLPNPMYGEWEGAIYDYKQLSEAEKAKARAEKMLSY